MELFAALGVPVQPSAVVRVSIPDDVSVAAGVIEYRGRQLVGKLLLVSTFDFIASCRPKHSRAEPLSPASPRDWIFVRDWAKELTNQLLGCVKRALAANGISVAIGLPIPLSGDVVRNEIASWNTSPQQFICGRHRMQIWFQAVTASGVELVLTSKHPPQLLPKAGSVTIF